ncbi:MAG: hypothetical protein ACFFC7_03365 [Candidatus Hermodarchaeota archaeon]
MGLNETDRQVKSIRKVSPPGPKEKSGTKVSPSRGLPLRGVVGLRRSLETIEAPFREWVLAASPLVSDHKPATFPGNPPALAGGGRQSLLSFSNNSPSVL